MTRTATTSLVTTCSRRQALERCAAGLAAAASLGATSAWQAWGAEPKQGAIGPRPWISIRGIYGGFPQAILDRGFQPADFGINAIWVGSAGLQAPEIDRYHRLGLKVFAEFNSMHFAAYLKQHPDAAPIGSDGRPSPPPEGWQGVSPFHAGYRQNRMDEFRRVLQTFEIDGIWLDYHHAHASWERDQPLMPDTDFSPAALKQFTKVTGIALPGDVAAAARELLGPHRDAWTQFRCDIFTDWVRQYQEIRDAVRPQVLLGTFHCPWSGEEHDGALRHKLAIDLVSQARHLDVFSIMPYHARFGHADDPSWIARQTQQLGNSLKLTGAAGEKQQIWPIVQLADWGQPVGVPEIPLVVDYATRQPATGVMAFHWSGISQQWEKLEKLGEIYRALAGMQS